MNKTELIDQISKQTEMTKADVDKFLKSFIDVVTEVLVKKDKISLIGFGSFKTSERKATTGRNPGDGSKIEIEARTVPKFIPGKTLKLAVKEGKISK